MPSLCRPLRPKDKSSRCKIESFCLILFTIAFISQLFNDPNYEFRGVSAFQQQRLPFRSARSDSSRATLSLANEDFDVSSMSSSVNFSLSPTSDTARRIVRENLGLSAEQHQQLAKLAVLVDDWNSKINLISRRDCSRDVVFGRHILPSLAPLALQSQNEEFLELSEGQKVCDVGTGGGFPGLPLAIARPDIDFLLVDSVGKKIKAVQDMADTLGLTNVKTYHGRAEAIEGDFSWVVGRSVSALPTYCFWIHHLLKKDGKLVYLIGGEIDEDILEEAVLDEEIEELLEVAECSDKRVLVFPKTAVDFLAEVSGEVLKVPKRGGAGDGTKSTPSRKNNKQRKKNAGAKGQWTKRDPSAAKDRGYSSFKRFDSLDN